jgi:hypothetical protein
MKILLLRCFHFCARASLPVPATLPAVTCTLHALSLQLHARRQKGWGGVRAPYSRLHLPTTLDAGGQHCGSLSPFLISVYLTVIPLSGVSHT